jgi:rhodanese-related sulfurtransferase
MTMATTVKEMVAAANAVVPKVTPDEVTALGDTALVVDLRDSTEIAATGKVRGAVNVTRGMLEFRADPESPLHMADFRKDRPVVFYCASGNRAALAGKTLLDLGFTDVRNAGKFTDLAAGGVPTEKD